LDQAALSESASCEQSIPFPEWKLFELLSRHHLGLTRFEIHRFTAGTLDFDQISKALEHLQASGMITSESYIRGELFYTIA
jgi:hypothetical protein